MPNIPPEDREEWLRQVREKLAREDAEKNKAKGGDGAAPNDQDADHAAREDEDNIVQLEQVRARRKMRLAEADESTVDKMVADGQADLAALAARFNAVYAVVNETGKCWVFRWRHDPALDREVLERIRRRHTRPEDVEACLGNQECGGLVVGKSRPAAISRWRDLRSHRPSTDQLLEPVARLPRPAGPRQLDPHARAHRKRAL